VDESSISGGDASAGWSESQIVNGRILNLPTIFGLTIFWPSCLINQRKPKCDFGKNFNSNKLISSKMKLITGIMAGTMALAVLILGAGGLHAQVTQVLTIKATASAQGADSQSTNSHTDVITYTTAAPIKRSVATKDFLALLATDYNTNFPSGAKLVQDGNSGKIEVVDKNNNLLQDVSSIISINSAGNNDITSGKSISTYPGLGTSSDLQLLTIKYDDTGAGGSLQFFLTGIGTGKTTDSTPNKTTGAYTRTSSGSLSSATGEGSYVGNPFVCTGTASASGKTTLNINPSPNSYSGNVNDWSGGVIVYQFANQP
jgi:hypothetical protein